MMRQIRISFLSKFIFIFLNLPFRPGNVTRKRKGDDFFVGFLCRSAELLKKIYQMLKWITQRIENDKIYINRIQTKNYFSEKMCRLIMWNQRNYPVLSKILFLVFILKSVHLLPSMKLSYSFLTLSKFKQD